ncbi:DegT/DnrJ/EryC1/StrS family aminotransferase [Kitasatospora cinereorecta]
MRYKNDILEYGFKANMNDINAAIGLANLDIIDTNLARHRDNAAYYDTELANTPGLQLTERNPTATLIHVHTLKVETATHSPTTSTRRNHHQRNPPPQRPIHRHPPLHHPPPQPTPSPTTTSPSPSAGGSPTPTAPTSPAPSNRLVTNNNPPTRTPPPPPRHILQTTRTTPQPAKLTPVPPPRAHRPAPGPLTESLRHVRQERPQVRGRLRGSVRHQPAPSTAAARSRTCAGSAGRDSIGQCPAGVRKDHRGVGEILESGSPKPTRSGPSRSPGRARPVR